MGKGGKGASLVRRVRVASATRRVALATRRSPFGYVTLSRGYMCLYVCLYGYVFVCYMCLYVYVL